MFERILLPLDGSTVGETALPAVEELALKLTPSTRVELVLLQILTDLTHYILAGETSTSVPYTEQEVAEIKESLAKYLEKIADGLKGKGLTVRTIVTTSSSAAEEILRVADEVKADLIAMATHGRHGLSRWAFGSVADRVLRESAVPVLIVRVPKATTS
jgi:nucleotide-binding universal stress UspA family protein